MAENWYMSLSGVKSVLDNVRTPGLEGAVPVNLVLEQRITSLKNLRKVVFDREKQFYNNFNKLKGLTPRQAMETLQVLVGVWNASGVRHMISDDAHNTIIAILTDPKYRYLNLDEIEEVTNAFLNEEGGKIFEEVSEEYLTNKLIEEINSTVKSSAKLSINKRGKNGAPSEPYVYFNITKVDGKYKLKINSNLDRDTKGKLKRALRALLEDRQYSTSGLSEAAKNTVMLQQAILGPITNSEVRAAVKSELDIGRIEQYNLAKKYDVIKGFLGEVYWAAFFKFLGANSVPVGDVKDTKGQSIGVDLVVNSYGFQVKNFNMRKSEGSIALGTRGQLKETGTFIVDRVGLSEEDELGNLLLNLYGSYAYHTEPDEQFAETEKELEKFLTIDASMIFSHYIDRIIRLDMEQTPKKGQIDLFGATTQQGEKTLLFNAFFLIGSKIVPSSAILDQIILALDTKEKTYVDFKITDLQRSPVKSKDDEKFEWKPKRMANLTKIAYTINLDVTKIINQAYSSI